MRLQSDPLEELREAGPRVVEKLESPRLRMSDDRRVKLRVEDRTCVPPTLSNESEHVNNSEPNRARGSISSWCCYRSMYQQNLVFCIAQELREQNNNTSGITSQGCAPSRNTRGRP